MSRLYISKQPLLSFKQRKMVVIHAADSVALAELRNWNFKIVFILIGCRSLRIFYNLHQVRCKR